MEVEAPDSERNLPDRSGPRGRPIPARCAGSGCVHRGQQTSCRQCDGLASDSNCGLLSPFAEPCSEEGQMSRPRGTGRIYNQKQSSILWTQYYRDGKMHRESTGTADKRKAIRILSRRVAEMPTWSFTASAVARM